MVEYMEAAPGGRTGEPAGPQSRRERRAEEAEIAHACERLWGDRDFVRLRRRYALLCGLLVTLFLSGYLTHLLLSAYARDFMSIRLADPVNVALVSGLGQFLLVFFLAWAFSSAARRWIDPLAARVRTRMETEHRPGEAAR
ncbi:DUF485 domain-containing protein [Nocardiopsis sp. HNM0947]|uniref:DUF485 domain-containing protein n=1 Tax=Nocardiopsis coralli TaxID=2772213 RepID=A0ABR9P7C8_9ACTN|nr:DUF485 domain-containing protein [Nocardiopsis coralli]MBE2999719.1 DUF485 domain-containing protein [Nocardiopsis coralli]